MEGRKERSQRDAHVLSLGNEEPDGATNRKFMAVRRRVSAGGDE